MCLLVFIYLLTFIFSELNLVKGDPTAANFFFFALYDGVKIAFEAFV